MNYKNYILMLLSLLFFSIPLVTRAAERDYQDAWCDLYNGETEVILKDKARVDCVTDSYAVEVDYAKKWAEAIGQALLYGYRTKRIPAVLLIVRSESDCKYLYRFNEAVHAGGVALAVFQIGGYSYQCGANK